MPAMSAVERAFCNSALWRGFARRTILPWALQGVTPHGDVLELGSGSGAMAEATARAHPGIRLTATDIDPAMVAAAAATLEALPNVEVRAADATDLPFPDASFDLVASQLMLHHVLEWPQALEEVARVLRPGGVLVGYDLEKTFLARAIHVVDRSPFRLVARDELAAALSVAGFESIEVGRALGNLVVRFTARKPG